MTGGSAVFTIFGQLILVGVFQLNKSWINPTLKKTSMMPELMNIHQWLSKPWDRRKNFSEWRQRKTPQTSGNHSAYNQRLVHSDSTHTSFSPTSISRHMSRTITNVATHRQQDDEYTKRRITIPIPAQSEMVPNFVARKLHQRRARELFVIDPIN